MIISTGAWIRIFSAIVAICGSAALSDFAGPNAPGTLSGTVVDVHGNPIADAVVFTATYDSYEQTDQPAAKTISGPDGSFTLTEPADRAHRDLRIVAAGFAPQSVPFNSFNVFPNVRTELGKIQVDQGQIITGQVLDIDGKPLPQAIVECQARRPSTGAGGVPVTPRYQVTTDGGGRFQTPRLPVSFVGLTVRFPGRRMAFVRVPVGPDGMREIPSIRLEPSVAIQGILRDEQQRPIAGASVGAYGWEFGPSWMTFDRLKTDGDGRFMLDGFGPVPRIQLQIGAHDHVFINRVIRGGPEGLRWADVPWGGDARELQGPVRELSFTMKPVAWMEGRAVDADDGQPVQLKQIVRCNFDRKPNGEIVLNGCTSSDFQQEPDGRFRLSYSIPDEYHLTLSAPGYADAEAFTPPVTQIQSISGIFVKMHKSASSAPLPAKQTIRGIVTRYGKPVKIGWITLVRVGRNPDKVNVPIRRGRTVAPSAGRYAPSLIQDGVFLLDVPYQDDNWRIIIEEPGQLTTEFGPFPVALNEEKTLDITAADPGVVSGNVTGIPAEWSHDAWVVAFTRTGLQFETRVTADGLFRFAQLPPGEYGLKAGHDAFLDAEQPPQILEDNSPYYGSPGEPWKCAMMVKVVAGEKVKDVHLSLPAE